MPLNSGGGLAKINGVMVDRLRMDKNGGVQDFITSMYERGSRQLTIRFW